MDIEQMVAQRVQGAPAVNPSTIFASGGQRRNADGNHGE